VVAGVAGFRGSPVTVQFCTVPPYTWSKMVTNPPPFFAWATVTRDRALLSDASPPRLNTAFL
jgi:hypothetical protein